MAADKGPRLKADLHVHTIASGHGFSTVREICAEAALKGIEMVGVTDHGPAMPGGPHLYNFTNLIVMPRVLSGVKVLRSAECNILDTDGTLDLPDRVLGILDVVHAGLHPGCGYEGKSVEDNTRALLSVIESGKVDILVHPGNPLFPHDYGTVVESAASKGMLVEINNASFTVVRRGSEGNCRKVLEAARRVGARICVGSDAHDASLVGTFGRAMELIDEAGIDVNHIMNRSTESVTEFLRDRGKDISW